MDNIPVEVGGAEVYSYIILTNTNNKTDNTRHFVDGELLDNFYGLAIYKFDGGQGFYLYYCDENWNEVTDTYHETIEAAKRQAECEFTNTINSWVDLKRQE
jgi:hypothetical protein